MLNKRLRRLFPLSRAKPAPCNNQRGIALIIVLWICVILSSIIIAGAYIARLEMRQAYAHLREIQLVGVAKAGVEEVKAKLLRDTSTVDGLAADWYRYDAESYGPATLNITIEGEESKINLNASPRNVLEKMPAVAGAANRDEIVDSLIDWRDADNTPQPNGGEEEFYQQRGPLCHCKNKPLDNLDELYLIKGCNGTVVAALKKMATVSSAGKVNVNTASLEALSALPGVNSALAEAIVKKRSGPDGVDGTADDTPFRAESEVKDIVGNTVYAPLANYIGTRSFNFKVRAVARYGRYTKVVESLLSRETGNVKIKYWRECF